MKKIFYADLRTLALVRVTLGFLVFYDLLRRLPFAEAFYSDSGILKRSVLLAKFINLSKPTILLLSGAPTFSIILLITGMIASLLYAIGARTRLMNFIMWLILVSFHERFSLALNAGDILLAILLFWSFFLPMNGAASWDKGWMEEEETNDFQVVNIFTVAWISHIFFMYIFTFFYKWHPDWFREGTTLYYALNLESFTTPIGKWLLNFPSLLKFMSISTLWLEGLAPWFLLLPFWVAGFRLILIALFWGLHLGILVTMDIGTFAPACLIFWLFLFPSEAWDWFEEAFNRKGSNESYEVYYDKDCGFCKRMVAVFYSLFCVKVVKVHSSEADKKIDKLIIEKNSWAGRNSKGEIFYEWENFLNFLDYSQVPLLRKFMGLIPMKMGRAFYQMVAQNRGTFSRFMRVIGNSDVHLSPSRIVSLFGVVMLILAFLYNLDGYKNGKILRNAPGIKRTVNFFRLNQKWNMFAPYPARTEGWLVVDGALENGKRWDPWRKGEVSFERPSNLGDEYPNNMWRKVVGRIRTQKYEGYRLYFGKFICRMWNETHPKKGERLQSFDIYFMVDRTPAPGLPASEAVRSKIWGHSCFKKTSWPN